MAWCLQNQLAAPGAVGGCAAQSWADPGPGSRAPGGKGLWGSGCPGTLLLCAQEFSFVRFKFLLLERQLENHRPQPLPVVPPTGCGWELLLSQWIVVDTGPVCGRSRGQERLCPEKVHFAAVALPHGLGPARAGGGASAAAPCVCGPKLTASCCLSPSPGVTYKEVLSFKPPRQLGARVSKETAL